MVLPLLVIANNVQTVVWGFTDQDVTMPVQEAVDHVHAVLVNTIQPVVVQVGGSASIAQTVLQETTGLLHARKSRLVRAVHVHPAVLEPLGLDALVQALDHV